MTTVSGAFGGEVLGLEFNVDFSDAGFLPGSSGIPFGNLLLAGFSNPVFNRLSVRQFLGDVSILLSGDSTIFSIADLGTMMSDVNSAFSNGDPTVSRRITRWRPRSPAPCPNPSTWLLLTTVVGGLYLTSLIKASTL